jgi:hypothetical protein
MIRVPTSIITVLLSVFLVSCFENHGKPAPVPPNLTDLEYRISFPMKSATGAGGSFLQAVVTGTRSYETPSVAGDCNVTNHQVYTFTMSPGDFADITLSSRNGVGTGPTDALAFQLSQEQATSPQGWNLIMKQSPTATDYLYFVTWRFKMNANVIPINNEIGTGGIAMPPAGQPPWERDFLNVPVGGTYRIYSLNNLVATVDAQLTFTMHRTLPPFCSAGPEF